MRYATLAPALAALVLWVAPVTAQAGRRHVTEGNRRYAEGRFEEARAKYLDALREAPNSPLIRFNEANALYQTEAFAEALEAYQRAVETNDQTLAAKAWYNLGNALYRQQQLQQSLEAYKEAMRLDPNDLDAKYNFEYVRNQMQQQGQQGQQEQEEQEEQEQPNDPDQNREENPNSDQAPPPSPSDSAGAEGENPPPPAGEEPSDPPTAEPPPPAPGGAPPMSREEAERLLQAIQENPEELPRGPKVPAQARRVKKPW